MDTTAPACAPAGVPPTQVQKYLSKLSGPLLDRIDLHVEVSDPPPSSIRRSQRTGPSTQDLKDMIQVATKRQQQRYKNHPHSRNGDLRGGAVETFCPLAEKEENFLIKGLEELGLSVRAYHKVLIVARTIADLEDRDNITTDDLSEALNYRLLTNNGFNDDHPLLLIGLRSVMLVLGIESTCDESSAAVLDGPHRLLSNVVKSQIADHQRYGGVVPEIASRLHLNILSSAIAEAVEQAGLSLQDIDLIAFSQRPGLIGGLVVGSTLAKSLSWLLDKPLIGVDHLLGHLLAPDIEEALPFPCVAGIFSGGHSNVYLGNSLTEWKLIAHSRDDAPGESFDKSAKLLGLPYPGGPSIQKLAEQGDEKAYSLPLPLPKSLEGDFSFSGLKTALLYYTQGTNGKSAVAPEDYPSLAASFQYTVAKGLTQRLISAAHEHHVKMIHVGGGVAANARLRSLLSAKAQDEGFEVRFPSLPLCMDNGAMIARAGLALYEEGHRSSLDIDVSSRSVLGLEC